MRRSNRLREIREEYGIVQQAVVAAGGFSGATMVAIEKHHLYPTNAETRQRLAEVLSELAGQEITESSIWPESEPLEDGDEEEIPA